MAPTFPPLPNEAAIRQRHPNITNPDNLQSLLIEIARQIPTSKLEANFTDDVWVISGKTADAIGEIEFKLATRLLVANLEGATQKFLGKTNSPEIEANILESVKEILAKDGYPNAQLEIKRSLENAKLTLQVDIDEGDPCYVDSIELAFPIPKGANFGISPGDICDLVKIKVAVDDFEDKLRSLGYTRLQLTYPGLIYGKGNLLGTIKLGGKLGGKIQYKIVDASKLFLIDDLFSQDEVAGLDPTIISPEAMTAELLRRYRNRGYVDATIGAPVATNLGGDSTLYTFSIQPGQKYSLGNVIFEGVTAFTHDDLLATMDLDRFWGNRPPLNLEEVSDGIDALKVKYQELGYWDVAIREPRITKDESHGQATMIITVNEGQERTFIGVDFIGMTHFTPEDFRPSLKIYPGGAIDRSQLLQFEQKIKESYLEEGFLYVKTNLQLKSDPQRTHVGVKVIVEVVEGTRVKIASVQVVGLNKTKSYVVERELTFKPGDWYKTSKVNSSRKTLVDLGIFRSVQISPADRSALFEKSNDLDILVEVREAKAGSIVFGPGYDIYRGFAYTAETSYTNLWGTGRQISMRGAISQEAQQRAIDNRTLIGRKIGAGYVEPFIFGLPVDGKVSVSHKATADDFWKFSQAAEISANHKLRNVINGGLIGVFYGQKLNREEGNSGQEEYGVTTGNVRIGRVGTRLDVDFRNNQAWPTDGFLVFSEMSWARYALGGDLNYFHWEITNNYYQQLTSNLVLAYGVSAAAYQGVEKEDDPNGLLPATERLNAGGPDLVRGFAEQLGPYIKRPVFDVETGQFQRYERDPIGGDRRVVLKTELRYRISQILGTSVFLDSGNAFLSNEQLGNYENRLRAANAASPAGSEAASLEENNGYSFDELIHNPDYVLTKHYYAYGLAGSLLSPIGAINFAYAWPLREPKSERCLADESVCLQRSKEGKQMYYRGRFELSVGAKF
jgi:outer membrane protein assembly complex protein YaeT